MNEYHRPVMAAEVVEYLRPGSSRRIVDGTAGGGGHALVLGERLGPDGVLVLIDRDPAALSAARDRLANLNSRTVFIHGDFRNLAELLDRAGLSEVDSILMDLGLSSRQLSDPERGFSFRSDSALDMRMNPLAGETAAELVARLDRRELTQILHDYGDERWAARIADFVTRERARRPIETTGQLADIVKAAIPRKAWPRDIHPATKTFQAIRIAVNDETCSLRQALKVGIPRLAVGGRIAVISYQSLEDREVKRAFLVHAGKCQCPPGLPECRCGAKRQVSILTRKPVLPSEAEVRDNPRARSAKLRVAERMPD